MKSSVAAGLANLSSYQASWLRRDLVAGLVLTALLVPQGMAYAELAGLPPITGLYTSILCLVAYAVFGPSKILVLGPDSSLGPMIAATIIPLVAVGDDPGQSVALASALALLVGVIITSAGVAHLGFIADLISKPTIIGYMNGLALTILVGQLPKLFGFSVDGDDFRAELSGFVRGVADGETVAAALGIGLFGLALILALGRWLPRVPGVLAAVVLSIVAAGALDLASHGVDLVGTLPQGFPPFTIPDVGLSDLGMLLGGAFGIALVSLADTISTASSFAARSGDEIDGRGEMIGIGAANISAGLFQGFPVSTSGSRTAVAEQAGAKTQVTGLVGAVAIALILLFFPGLLRDLPQPTLAAVVIAASLSLANIPETLRLRRIRRTEYMLSMAAFLGVVLFGVLPGIALGGRPVDRQRLPAGVVAVPDDAGARTRHRRVPRRRPATRTRASCPAASSSGSTRRCSSPTPAPSASRSGPSPPSSPGLRGSSSPPSPSPTWTRPRPTCSASWTRSSTPAASTWSSRR